MLVLRISDRMADLVLHSSFADEGRDAYDLHQAILKGTRSTRGALGGPVGGSVVVGATPDSWDEMARWLEDHSKTPRGASFDERTRARRLQAQSERITHELEHMAAHPAYTWTAVAGRDTTVLPACRIEGDSRLWPTRRMAQTRALDLDSTVMEHGELQPHTTKRKTRVFTMWRFAPA